MSYELKDPDNYEYLEKAGDYSNDVVRTINNNAYKQQEVGQLEQYLIDIQINITKEELEALEERIKRRRMKRR